jgi:hypothetical protein
MRKTTAYLLLICFGFAMSCGVWKAKKLVQQHHLAVQNDTFPIYPKNPKFAQITYLGCGGFMIEYEKDKILIDPYFSNVSVMDALTRPLESDTALINQFFQKKIGTTLDSLGQISTILISHAHHDHLADVPTLLKNNLNNHKISVLGSKTMVNLLRSYANLVKDTATQLVNLERQFSTMSVHKDQKSIPEASTFFYTPNRSIRITAIPSSHAGHYKLIKGHKLPFTAGQLKQPLKSPPLFMKDFREGQNFNFMIDLLDREGKMVYRIFSNAGAGCDAGVGFPPSAMLLEHSVDMLLLCGANYNVAKNYPFPLIEYLAPKTIFVAHWENFFKSIPKLLEKPEVVPNTNIPKLMRKLAEFAKVHDFPKEIIIKQPLTSTVLMW